MTHLMVIKKDNTLEPWSNSKVKLAIKKAANRGNITLTDETLNLIIHTLRAMLVNETKIRSVDLHPKVIAAIRAFNANVADSYQSYRDYKTGYAHEFEKLKDETDRILYLGDKENANFDSSLVSTKGSLVKGYLTKSLYKQFYLSMEEKELTKRGDIYIHDLRDMILNSVNCCLFDIGTVLKGGFEMSNIKYTEPNSVLAALQVIGDISLCATAQQFGGFTLAELDKVLLPYCKKTYNKAYSDYAEIASELMTDFSEFDDYESWKAEAYARDVVMRELEQGFQALELKLNTVPCSRGDFAFTTITFGEWDLMMDDLDRDIMKMIGEVILRTRMKGHSGRQVVFPKLVFLYNQSKIQEDKDHAELFEQALKCSAKCMYPDYLAIDSDHGTVSDLYKKHGVITSPMGCRAYLSPWKDPKTGKYVTVGRCNIGAVSLNLPLIYTYAVENDINFFDVLADRLEVIRTFLKKRYDVIAKTKASTNPLAFTQGGFYNGYRDPDECVGDLVKYMTASFGITALNELTLLATGKTIYEDKSQYAQEVIKFIKTKVEHFKHEDGYLYALYGTPAESLCGTQAKQYDAYCSAINIPNILNKEYFTNSFHMHVSENITPIEKQDAEMNLFHLIEGGHIQYVRIDNPENITALKAVIQRGMKMGFYQGVNFDSVTCEHCGSHSTNITKQECPVCGSKDISIISRTCGYLGYSKLNGDSRMNEAKMAEIRDRVSM